MNTNEKLRALGERLSTCCDMVGGPTAMALKSGIPKRTLDSYRYQGVEPKWSNLCAVAETAGVLYQWLMTGEGPMHANQVQEQGQTHQAQALDSDEYAYIPGYDVQVSAGTGALADQEPVTRHLAFRRKWLNFRGLSEKHLVAIFAKGDSMEPTIADNNTLMVDTSAKAPQDGSIYVIRDGDMLLVKRVQRVFGGGLRLISDNKQYPEQVVDPIDLDVIGRVVWIGKDV